MREGKLLDGGGLAPNKRNAPQHLGSSDIFATVMYNGKSVENILIFYVLIFMPPILFLSILPAKLLCPVFPPNSFVKAKQSASYPFIPGIH
jgi:hypothetical protein